MEVCNTNILAIDTSGKYSSVSIINNSKVLHEIILKDNNNHSVTIMPLIDRVLSEVNLNLDNIEFLACTKGPGSFTGLRVGVATIKAISQALSKNVVSISTLEALAYNISRYEEIKDFHQHYKDYIIVPIIDARSERIFTGIYEYDNIFKIKNIYQDTATTISEFIPELLGNISNIKNKNIIFLGDGAIVYNHKIQQIIAEYKNINYSFIENDLNYVNATSVGLVAMEYIKSDEYITSKDLSKLDIEYLKQTQAERELLDKNKINK